MSERRTAGRHRTLKAGTIVLNEGLSTIDCLVRNLSESGARLEVENPLTLPDRFELTLDGHSKACDGVWKSVRHVGIRFA